MASTSSCTSTTITSSRRLSSKNKGLTLNLSCGNRSKATHHSVVRRVSGIDSLSNTPELVPSASSYESDGDSDYEVDEGGAQYIYIYEDSPFYKRPSVHRSRAPSKGLSFACDALADDEYMFAEVDEESPALSCSPARLDNVLIAAEQPEEWSMTGITGIPFSLDGEKVLETPAPPAAIHPSNIYL